jgi:hypothetical protein
MALLSFHLHVYCNIKDSRVHLKETHQMLIKLDVLNLYYAKSNWLLVFIGRQAGFFFSIFKRYCKSGFCYLSCEGQKIYQRLLLCKKFCITLISFDKCEHFCKWTARMVPLGTPAVAIFYILYATYTF